MLLIIGSLILILLNYNEVVSSQDNFTVIKVSGDIIIQRTGSPLFIGTKFSQDENLSFKSAASRAAVINPERGRYLLSADNSSEFMNSKSVFLPSTGKISARAGSAILNANDLKEYFEGKYVIFDKVYVVISPDIFPMNDKNYFYIRYMYKDEVINKKLTFHEDSLFIIKNELFTVDGKQIPNPDISGMKLMYMEEGEKYISTPVCSFIPVFPDMDKLKEEVQIIIEQLQNKTYTEKLVEISSFINDFYGNPDEKNLKNWLKENFGFSE